MHRPSASTRAPAPLSRRLVLGGAFLLGLAFALTPRTSTVHAQQAPAAPATAAKPAAPSKASIPPDRTVGQEKNDKKDADSSASPTSSDDAVDEDSTPATGKSSSGKRGIVIGKHGHIKIDGLGGDREFDSFNDMVHDEPAIAAMIVSIVSVVFLAPVLLIGLILWYRFRRARMLNETMLKLAEKGVVSPADAIDALAGAKSGPALERVAGAAVVYEQAKQVRRRAAWSDLRKGVFTGAAGLALTLFSIFDDQSPNSVGLVLLFVGIGFVVLWWFEERQLAPAPGSVSSPPPGGSPPSA